MQKIIIIFNKCIDLNKRYIYIHLIIPCYQNYFIIEYTNLRVKYILTKFISIGYRNKN
jgi:hypothetical protein